MELPEAPSPESSTWTAAARIATFEKGRLRAYGYLAMFAPQEVMDAHDALVDYVLASLEGSVPFDFVRLRTLAIAMLNAIRIDLGIEGVIRRTRRKTLEVQPR